MLKARSAIAAVALIPLVILVSPAGALPLDPSGTFNDDDRSVHEADIEALAAAGVTFGCNPPSNDEYCPEAPVTRAQVASFIVRSLALSAPLPDPTVDAFLDDDSSVHATDIDKLAELGVARGCNPPANDRFCPDAPVTRGQLAAFLTRAFDYVDDDPDADRFSDDDDSIFEADIEALAAAGVTVGCNPPDNDLYCPAANTTRAQMASFLTRALGLTPLAPPSVGEAHLVRPAFLLDQPAGGPTIATVARYVEPGSDMPADAVAALLDGLKPEEKLETTGSPGFSDAIPDGTELRGVDVASGVATVDLSGEFDDGGGSFSMLARLAQLTFTLLPFDDIDEVALKLDGTPVTVFSSEGLDIADGLDLAYFNDTGLLAEKTPLSPGWFEFVESPFMVTGYSRAFEATVNWELYDEDGLLLNEGFATTGSGDATFREMEFSVTYSVDEPAQGTLVVFEFSAKDGSITDARDTALWLMP